MTYFKVVKFIMSKQKRKAPKKVANDNTPLDVQSSLTSQNRQLFTKGVKEFNASKSPDDYDRVIQIFDEVI